jgi:hypothetical protein
VSWTVFVDPASAKVVGIDCGSKTTVPSGDIALQRGKSLRSGNS